MNKFNFITSKIFVYMMAIIGVVIATAVSKYWFTKILMLITLVLCIWEDYKVYRLKE